MSETKKTVGELEQEYFEKEVLYDPRWTENRKILDDVNRLTVMRRAEFVLKAAMTLLADAHFLSPALSGEEFHSIVERAHGALKEERAAVIEEAKKLLRKIAERYQGKEEDDE